MLHLQRMRDEADRVEVQQCYAEVFRCPLPVDSPPADCCREESIPIFRKQGPSDGWHSNTKKWGSARVRFQEGAWG